MVYFITYNLKKPSRFYNDFITSLKSFGTWWHQTDSTWLIVTSKSTSEVRDYLKQFIDSNDQLFVSQLQRNWAATGFTKEEYNWLKTIPDTLWNR